MTSVSAGKTPGSSGQKAPPSSGNPNSATGTPGPSPTRRVRTGILMDKLDGHGNASVRLGERAVASDAAHRCSYQKLYAGGMLAMATLGTLCVVLATTSDAPVKEGVLYALAAMLFAAVVLGFRRLALISPNPLCGPGTAGGVLHHPGSPVASEQVALVF